MFRPRPDSQLPPPRQDDLVILEAIRAFAKGELRLIKQIEGAENFQGDLSPRVDTVMFIARPAPAPVIGVPVNPSSYKMWGN